MFAFFNQLIANWKTLKVQKNGSLLSEVEKNVATHFWNENNFLGVCVCVSALYISWYSSVI